MKKYRIYLDSNSRKATHIVTTAAEVLAIIPEDKSVCVDLYDGRQKVESYLAKNYMGELMLDPCFSISDY